MSTTTSAPDQDAMRVANRYAGLIEKATTLQERARACEDAAEQYRRDARANVESVENHRVAARTIRDPHLAHQHAMVARDAEAEATREILAARYYEAQAEQYQVQARGITPAGLAGAGSAGLVLDEQTGVQKQYDTNPDAGDKDYQARGGIAAASGADDVPRLRPRPADETPPDRAARDEIPPQWPGHQPRRRWEWKVSAHRPGDRQHVQVALPSVDLASDQAIRTYVQATLQRYDRIELHHWYSGSELTFTRQPDGSVDVARRQLRPTDGAPGNQR